MKLGTKKDDMATFVEEPDYSSFTETEFANNSLSKEDERIISKLIAIPDDPLDDLGAQMVDRLRRDLSANIAVLDRHEDFNKWLEQKRKE